jgi:hypothetical protein
MALTSNPAAQTAYCKIKAVNPPFRSVSTPRQQNDFREAARLTRHRTAAA